MCYGSKVSIHKGRSFSNVRFWGLVKRIASVAEKKRDEDEFSKALRLLGLKCLRSAGFREYAREFKF